MNLQKQITTELEELRVQLGRHMMALDSMSPRDQNNTYLCDLERLRRIIRELEKLEK